MSFLDQLKSQASALQSQQNVQQQDLASRITSTHQACETIWRYFAELARQLNVIVPDGPSMAIDGRQFWPPTKLADFRSDPRKKMLANREVYDHVSLGWLIQPRDGTQVKASISVNFPPELEKVTNRLHSAQIRHERVEIRHPEKNTLLAIRFDYSMLAMGSVRATADYDRAEVHFRWANIVPFEVSQVRIPANRITSGLLDELAKLLVGQPGEFR